MKPQASLLQTKRFFACVAVLLGASLFSPSAPASPEWDIAGLRLGMTEAQVRAAFTAYDPKGKIVAQNLNYSYSDGVSSLRTPPFLSRLELRVTRMAMHTPLIVWFSGTGGEARAIAIRRHESNLPNPPSRAQFMQSLLDKYGDPSARNSADAPYWEEPGKPSCIWVGGGGSPKDIADPFASNLDYKNDLSEGAAELERRQQGTSRKALGLPPDLGQCGAYLFYYGTNRDPASGFTGVLIDAGAIVTAQRAREAWVTQLEAEAIGKRAGQGQVPKL